MAKKKRQKTPLPIKISFSRPFHPLLVAAFPVLFLYATNINELLLNSIFLPLAVLISFALLFFLVINFFLKDAAKTSILVTFYFLLFFSYGHIKNTLGDFDFRIGGFGIGPDKTLTVTWIALFVLITYFTIKTRKNLKVITDFLNIASVFLVVVSLANIAVFELKTGRLASFFETSQAKTQTADSQLIKPDTPPDIYYLIFDRYASKHTLDQYYDYDTSDFFGYLTKKGFFVAADSHANYPATFLSLASSLNMKELNYLSSEIGEESNDRTRVYEMLQDYKVQRLLQSIGYKYIHVGAWWQPTRVNKYADYNFTLKPENLGYLNLDEFSTNLLETTILPPILSALIKNNEVESIYSRNNHRNMILYELETLEKIVEKFAGPKFVFAHVLVPHGPYVLDNNCEPLTQEEAEKIPNERNYLNQLDCANKKIKSLVSKILSKSSDSAIIVLQADEGPAPIIHRLASKWQESNTDAIQEKTGVLNAYYLPNIDKNNFYPTITPVNTFRLIFNVYFGTDYELLEDKVYVFEDTNHPYKLFDVTEKVQ